ncbi:MAG: 2-C-methyl-D-erythritol 4-phosphate cytidylyltransferase [Candidatus Methylacidiphilales bacterium]
MSADCNVVLLAAGRSRRLGFDKILTPLAGKPAFRHALDVLCSCPESGRLILVTRDDLVETFFRQLTALELHLPWEVISGGEERQDSVLKGLKACDPELPMVVIHDAARPLLTRDLVTQVVTKARISGAAICGKPCADTLKRSSPEQVIIETIPRESIWLVETPQVFRLQLILSAYEKVAEEGARITDDASAMEYAGHPVSLVATPTVNLKITNPADWSLLEALLSTGRQAEIRHLLHQANNHFMPISGYVPLLAKYRENESQHASYIATIRQATTEVLEDIRAAQFLLRESNQPKS